MDRMTERQQIVATLEDAEHAQETVNSREDVIAARAVHDKAREAEHTAHAAFKRLWREVYPDDARVVRDIKAQHREVITTGWSYPVLLRCAATGFPILKGDRVVTRGTIGNGDLTLVLADVIRPEVLETLDVTVIQSAADIDEDAEGDDDTPDEDEIDPETGEIIGKGEAA